MVAGMPASLPFPGPGPAASRFLFLRVSPDDQVLYANVAFAEYLGVDKAALPGTALLEIQNRLSGEMRGCLQRPHGGKQDSRLMTDASGRVFEVRTRSEHGMLDIVLTEVTDAEKAFGELLRRTGTPAELLTEDEIRALRQPERRLVTISSVQLRGFGAAAGTIPPHDAQLMLDAFAEEMGEAILSVASTIGQSTGERITGIFGAPRWHKDHALRAVLAACLQMDRIAALDGAFCAQGSELPPCSIGIACGEALLAVIDGVYTAQGAPADLAASLARIARPGEILLTEATFESVLANLPENWEFFRTTTEEDPDLGEFQWEAVEVQPLPEKLRRIACLVGENVSEDTSRTQLYFDYLFAITDPLTGESVPILRVVRPQTVESAIELDHGNVAAAGSGMNLGRYRLLEVVGEGGMGKVWRAEDRFGNTLAVKVLHTNEATQAQLQRFKREAEIMARLPHRNICRVYEFNEFEGVNYIAMEFVDGVTLSDLLYLGDYERASRSGARFGPPLPVLIRTIRSLRLSEPADGENVDHSVSRILPEDQTLRIIGRICDAVQFAHEHGVLHRDLKPGNILLREDGEPLVADFGLAKIDSLQSVSLSLSGHVVGTVENMAPEQAVSSKDVDGRADVFSIGTILYQLLTGRKFFTATGNLVADAQALQNYTFPKPRALNPRIDPDLELITLKALRADRDDRYRSVAALRADLERYERGEPISARPIAAGELFRKLVMRNKPLSAAIAVSILVITVGLAVAAWTINDRRLDAEAARRIAERARLEAEERRQEAETARALAEQKQAEAEQALAEAEKAREAEREARGLHDEAVARVRQASEEREAAEAQRQQLATLASEQAQQLEETRTRLQEIEKRDRQEAALLANPDVIAAAVAMDEALSAYQFGFAPEDLAKLDGPSGIFERMNYVMVRLCKVLELQPESMPALAMKTRLHLADLDVDAARATINKAMRVAAKDPEAAKKENLEPLGDLVLKLDSAGLPSASEVSAALRRTGFAHDRIAANILDAMATDRTSRRLVSKSGHSPLGRPTLPEELAFRLRLGNPNVLRVGVSKSDTEGWTVELLGANGPVDLTPLANREVQTLRIQGATEFDWSVLFALPLKSLDLSGSAVRSIPLTGTNRELLQLRKLDLSNTPLTELRPLALLPLLENLDISNTPVRSLAALSGRKLTHLNIAGCKLASLEPLTWMPLHTLIVGPESLPLLTKTPRLRASRTLQVIRTPDDPDTQSTSAFWKKLDAGAYAEASGDEP